MSRTDTLCDTAIGVLEELRVDLRDGLWSIFQLLGINNTIDQVIHDVHNWRAGESNICGHKVSVLRILGAALPLKPVARPYLKFVVVRNASRSSSVISYPMTVESDILTNESYREYFSRSNASNFSNEYRLNSVCLRSSLPIPDSDSQAVNVSSDTAIKLAQLESELQKLRDQITSVICQNTTKPPTPPHTPVPNTDCVPHPLPTFSHTVKPPFIPPPPPPPPPCMKINPKESFSQIILQRKSSNKQSEPINRKHSENGNVSMTDVLKGLSSVKLKRIDRSPGGTPVRILRSPDPKDPASLIAAALKKRFAQIHMDSPEKDGEISDFGSPVTPVRKSRRDSFSPKVAHQISNSSARDLRPAFKKAALITLPVTQENTAPFGQHLLRRRSFIPQGMCKSESPSSESSNLSR